MKNQESRIKNQEYSQGQAVITAVIFLLLISLAVIFGLVSPVLRESKISRDLILSKQSYFLAEAGAEDLVYRLKTGRQYNINENLELNGFSAAVATVDLSGDEKEIISTADVFNLIRKIKIKLTTDSGVSFHYGLQVGEGGLVMENNSLVSGNVYSNGPVQGFNSNLVKGDVVSAGPDGLVDGIYATSSVYSHNISNTTIDGDAYYVDIFNSTVGGILYPNSSDQATSTLPIPDSTIEEWENAAALSEITSPCPYVIKSDISLGPIKIACDLKIQGSPIVTLFGPVWVTGNLEIENSAVIRLDSSLGKKSVAIIADNPSNRLENSRVMLKNSVRFEVSGIAGSYILVISQNNSSENGGSERAIETENSVSGDLLLYASHGEILLKNHANYLKEAAGYKIKLQNTANVIYETGLADLLFKSGPGGGYKISGWREIE